MTKTNITVRVDKDLKKTAEQACEFLGVTFTAVIYKALNQIIEEASRSAELHNSAHKKLSSAIESKLYLSAGVRDAKALQLMNYKPPEGIHGARKMQLDIYLSSMREVMDNQLLDIDGTNHD